MLARHLSVGAIVPCSARVSMTFLSVGLLVVGGRAEVQSKGTKALYSIQDRQITATPHSVTIVAGGAA